MTACLTPDLAQALVLGDAEPTEAAAAEDHLATCRPCRRWISALLAEFDPGGRNADGPATTAASAMTELHAGDRLGRYTLRRWLGGGGMGVVFAAFDPLLQREVAIKHLRNPLLGAARVRFRHEARTLASLRDPNIVELYDVGTAAARSYLVMELVRGTPLQRWLAERRRSSHSLLGVLLGAGRGLSAAHSRGVLHRDIKPSNVIVADDGRARVIDFGLAADVPATAATGPAGADGAVVGTPGFVAPELLAGRPASVASDVYAYCVTLAVAFGDPPARGAEQALAGATMPRWLRPILSRGLAEDPQLRWPSVDALLRAIERGRPPGRWRAVVLALATVGAVAWVAAPSPDAPCPERGSVGRVWNGAAAASVEHALATTGVPWAEHAVGRVRSRLDAFGQRWRDMYEQICRDPTEPRFAARQRCLADQVSRLRAVVGVLSEIDPEGAAEVDALLDLPDPRSCADAARNDATSGASALRLELRTAEALEAAGQSADALDAAAQLAPRVADSGSASLAARLALVQGAALMSQHDTDGVAHLQHAVALAAEADDDELEATAAVAMAEALVLLLGRTDASAERALSRATAHVERVAADARFVRRLARVEGARHEDRGEYEAALAAYARAEAASKRAYGSDSSQYATTLGDQARQLHALGRLEESLVMHAQAVQLFATSVGDAHPWTAAAMEGQGNTLAAAGRADEAVVILAEVVAIRSANGGPSRLAVAVALGNLGAALVGAGRLDEAVPKLERAIATQQQLDPDHPRVASALNSLGNAHQLAGRLEAAAQAYSQGAVLLEAALGSSHPDFATLLGGLASVQVELRPARAVDSATRALELRTEALGAGHPALAFNQLVLGQAQHADGDPAAALATLHAAERLAAPAGRLLPDIRAALAAVEVTLAARRREGPL